MSDFSNVPEWATRIISAHLGVTDSVSHNERMKSDRYFVWQEEGERRLICDGKTCLRVVCGSTDLFTRQEFDPWKAEFEGQMTAAGIAWAFEGVQYEEKTGLYHYEWTWEVLG